MDKSLIISNVSLQESLPMHGMLLKVFCLLTVWCCALCVNLLGKNFYKMLLNNISEYVAF